MNQKETSGNRARGSGGKNSRKGGGRTSGREKKGNLSRGDSKNSRPGQYGEAKPSAAGSRNKSTGNYTKGKAAVPERPRKDSGPGREENVRLNKYIASSGICSRREADQLITAGLISVNGKTVKELGTKVGPADKVLYNGSPVRNERKVYLLLNKPKDFVTTTRDPKERKTVMLLVQHACRERIYPVGRLDRQTTGVLLFTNDGELAKKLTHPGYNKKKIYHVFLDKGMSTGDFGKLADGITLEDGFIQPDALSYVTPDSKKEVGLEIHSGRNRIVRRMFEHLGYRVTRLDRVYFAGLTKKNLPRGKWRFLTDTEIRRLKTNAYE